MENRGEVIAKEIWEEAVENLNERQKGLLFGDPCFYASIYQHRSFESLKAALDEDLKIAEELTKASLGYGELKVGDWVDVGGEYKRIAYIVGEKEGVYKFQPEKAGAGSYCLSRSGNASMSGTLESPIEGELLKSDETREGHCWFWHRDEVGAGMGVHTTLPFRVWKFRAAESKAAKEVA